MTDAAAQEARRFQISDFRSFLLNASLDELKTRILASSELEELLPIAYLTTLNNRQLARAYRYILMCWFVTDGWICPRELQIKAAMGIWEGRYVFVQAGTGVGKTLAAVLNQLLEPEDGVILIISPLKRLQSSQVCSSDCSPSLLIRIPGRITTVRLWTTCSSG